MDNDPLPRDRVFFTYDYFNRVPLSGDVNVHSFVLGFEKTFCDRLALSSSPKVLPLLLLN